MNNKKLKRAKDRKNDEFYTLYDDIATEVRYYKKYFKDKVVLCNCDDPRVSNFHKFFMNVFHEYEIKSLICTCYKSKDLDLFSWASGCTCEQAIYTIYDGEKEETYNFNGDGDFRSAEAKQLLEKADIIVTNPPFSLFTNFIDLLIKYDKKFLVLGNKMAFTLKSIFKLFKQNKIWSGVTPWAGGMYFETILEDDVDKVIDGINTKNVASVWFTNLEHKKRAEELYCEQFYDEEYYDKYTDYDAINVDEVKMIPNDYKGIMGVPITFIEKYNPNQFEIIDLLSPKSLTKNYPKRLMIKRK